MLAVQLAKTLEESDQEDHVDDQAANVGGGIGCEQQQSSISTIKQHADHKCRFTALPGKNTEQYENADYKQIDLDDSGHLAGC